MKNPDKTIIINWLLGIAVVVVIISIVWSGTSPKDFEYDLRTGTSTWTDSDGRKLLKSPNGTVVEVSK